MSIVLTTSSCEGAAHVSQDTPDLRGRTDDNRAQDLETLRACSACVSQDTPDLRGRADDNRAQDLEHCEHAAHCVSTKRASPAAFP